MSREKEKVKTIESVGPGKDVEVRSTHPAFAMIGAARVGGHIGNLYGSPIQHSSCVRITICFSEQVTRLHSDWHFTHQPIVEVELSEAQWAGFVSTLNMGSGVPCTLRLCRGGELQRLPAIEPAEPDWTAAKAADIKRQVEEDMQHLRAGVKALRKLLEQSVVRKKDLQAVLDQFLLAVEHAPANYKFVHDSLVESSEELLTAAKAEVSAMVTNLALRFPGLQDHAPELGSPDEPKRITREKR